VVSQPTRRAPLLLDTFPGTLVFRALDGSFAHGTNTPTSDEDWRGVFMLPNNDFLGLGFPKTTYEAPPDQVFWELGHFCRLLLKGNPNIVGMLFAPADCIDFMARPIDPLTANAERFLSSAMAAAYMGWIKRELHDIGKLHKGHAKRLSHIPRLLWEIESVVKEGTLVVRPGGAKQEAILAIKTGAMDYEKAEAFVGGLLLDIEEAVERHTFPDPPTVWTSEYLLQTRETYG
jgi:hypothetical protein